MASASFLEFVRENTQTTYCVWNPVFPLKLV